MKDPGYHAFTNQIMSTKPPKHMRVKGTGKPGQRFDVERLEKLCHERKLDPCAVVVEALKVIGDDALKTREKADVALKLMEYLMPKQRAVEHSGSIGLGLSELLEQADEVWKRR